MKLKNIPSKNTQNNYKRWQDSKKKWTPIHKQRRQEEEYFAKHASFLNSSHHFKINKFKRNNFQKL